MKNEFDVVIIGAGPAGAFLAYLLARAGISAAILERKKLPRTKPCGGGITQRALSLLPFSIEPVIEDRTRDLRMAMNGRPIFSKKLETPAITMVMRDQFDHLLIQKAIEAGAVLLEETQFIGLEGMAGSLSVHAVHTDHPVHTDQTRLKARLIAAADGLLGKTAAALKLPIAAKRMTALEGEVYCRNPKILESFRNTAHFDFGMIEKGYGWIFPKSDHLSAGVLTLHPRIQSLKKPFEAYLRSKGITRDIHVRRLRGHPIPYAPAKKSRFSNPKGLVLGDAAGITDPITGEGIYFALKEARIAAEVIAEVLSGTATTAEYDRRIKTEILADAQLARLISHLVYSFSRVGNRVMDRFGRESAENLLKIITGEISYRQLYQLIFNPPEMGRIIRGLIF